MPKRILKFLGLLLLTSSILLILTILILFRIGVLEELSLSESASLGGEPSQVGAAYDEGSVINAGNGEETTFGDFADTRSEGWKGSVVFGDVEDISTVDKKMGISVNLPKEMRDTVGYKVFSVKCLEDMTDLVSSDNQRLIRSDVDIFGFAETGDYIYAYCLDSGCDTIGGECVLVK